MIRCNIHVFVSYDLLSTTTRPHGCCTAHSSALTVVASVVVEFLLVEVNDVGTDVVQEVLVVRHDEQRLAPVL